MNILCEKYIVSVSAQFLPIKEKKNPHSAAPPTRYRLQTWVLEPVFLSNDQMITIDSSKV